MRTILIPAVGIGYLGVTSRYVSTDALSIVRATPPSADATNIDRGGHIVAAREAVVEVYQPREGRRAGRRRRRPESSRRRRREGGWINSRVRQTRVVYEGL